MSPNPIIMKGSGTFTGRSRLERRVYDTICDESLSKKI